MTRNLVGWEEELSTNGKTNSANLILQDWREQNNALADMLENANTQCCKSPEAVLFAVITLLRARPIDPVKL